MAFSAQSTPIKSQRKRCAGSIIKVQKICMYPTVKKLIMRPLPGDNQETKPELMSKCKELIEENYKIRGEIEKLYDYEKNVLSPRSMKIVEISTTKNIINSQKQEFEELWKKTNGISGIITPTTNSKKIQFSSQKISWAPKNTADIKLLQKTFLKLRDDNKKELLNQNSTGTFAGDTFCMQNSKKPNSLLSINKKSISVKTATKCKLLQNMINEVDKYKRKRRDSFKELQIEF